jgi:hypothetical protein
MAWYDKWAIMVIVAAIGVAGYNCIPWCKMDITIWAYWVAAIGTTGTLLGTLWIATSENRRRRNEASAIARLTAAAMYFQQIHNEGNAASALQSLQCANNPQQLEIMDMSVLQAFVSNSIQLLKKIVQWSPAELLRLAPLPHDCAAQLAAAQGKIGSTIALLENIGSHGHDHVAFFKQLDTNCMVLRNAVAQLQHTSQIFATVVDHS